MHSNQQIRHRERDLAAGRSAEIIAGGLNRIQELACSRRQFIRGAAASLGGLIGCGLLGRPLTALADKAVETGKFIFPRLQFSVKDNTPDKWDAHLMGDVNLRKKLKELTNVNVSMEQKVVRLENFDDMVRHPFVFMTSEGHFELPEKEEKNFKEFLERGGFIMADDCVFNGSTKGGEGDRFFLGFSAMVNKMYPDNPMRKIPYDHELFHIYYDFPNGAPHMQGVAHGAYGLFEPGTGRLMTILTPGDIHCAWCMAWFGEKNNMEGIKFGINEIIYFLSH